MASLPALVRAGRVAALLAPLAACNLTANGGAPVGNEGGARTTTRSSSTVETTSAGAAGGAGTAPATGLRIFAGGDDTCVVSAAGHVACWGTNETGCLGVGDFTDRRTPTWIPGLADVVDLAIADFAMCAAKKDGSVWCWGMNAYGQLGAPTDACPGLGYGCSTTPVLSEAAGGARRLVAGVHDFCAVSADGMLTCWGVGATSGLPGVPVISGSAGEWHTCARFQPKPGEDATRNVLCTGKNTAGKLGIGAGSPGDPVASGPLGGFVEIASGADFTCGVGATGEVRCWGVNQFGELALGPIDPNGQGNPEYCIDASTQSATSCSTVPVAVPGLPFAVHVAAHWTQACALTLTGDVYCWGTPSRTSPASANACFVGTEGCWSSPVQIPGVSHATGLAVGYGHGCALTAGDEVYCWGLDTHGQLGRGDGPELETTAVKVEVPPQPM